MGTEKEKGILCLIAVPVEAPRCLRSAIAHSKTSTFSTGKCFVDLFVLICFLTDELTRSLFNIVEISNSYFKSLALLGGTTLSHLVVRLFRCLLATSKAYQSAKKQLVPFPV